MGFDVSGCDEYKDADLHAPHVFLASPILVCVVRDVVVVEDGDGAVCLIDGGQAKHMRGVGVALNSLPISYQHIRLLQQTYLIMLRLFQGRLDLCS